MLTKVHRSQRLRRDRYVTLIDHFRMTVFQPSISVRQFRKMIPTVYVANYPLQYSTLYLLVPCAQMSIDLVSNFKVKRKIYYTTNYVLDYHLPNTIIQIVEMKAQLEIKLENYFSFICYKLQFTIFSIVRTISITFK